jgi:hypothetical protein
MSQRISLSIRDIVKPPAVSGQQMRLPDPGKSNSTLVKYLSGSATDIISYIAFSPESFGPSALSVLSILIQ